MRNHRKIQFLINTIELGKLINNNYMGFLLYCIEMGLIFLTNKTVLDR